jgi:hypothetical protein
MPRFAPIATLALLAAPAAAQFVNRATWLGSDDEPFRRPDEALDAYARSWALTYFLVQTRKDAFVAYLQKLSQREPLAADSPDSRRQDFTDAFGAPPAAFEEPLLKFMARLR